MKLARRVKRGERIKERQRERERALGREGALIEEPRFDAFVVEEGLYDKGRPLPYSTLNNGEEAMLKVFSTKAMSD